MLDQTWVDQTTLKTANQLDFLLSEYKKQKDEGVKVSKDNHYYNFMFLWRVWRSG